MFYLEGVGTRLGFIGKIPGGLTDAGGHIRIFDRMRVLWRPFLDQPGMPVAVSPPPDNFLYLYRTNVFYRFFFRQLWRDVIPPALAGILILVMLAGLARGLYAIMNAAGFVCARAVSVQGETGVQGRGVFSCSNICWSSGLAVVKGQRYRITLRVNEQHP